jgi:hypothetical protein
MPRKLAPTPSAADYPQPIEVAGPIVPRWLAALVFLFNRVVTRGLENVFPVGTSPAEARQLVVDAIAAGPSASKAASAHGKAFKSRLAITLLVKKALRALTRAVNNNYGIASKNEGRGDFFPPKGSEQTLEVRLEAFIRGMGLHPLPGIPQRFTVAYLQGLLDELTKADLAHTDASGGKEGAAARRKELLARAKVLYRQLGSNVEGVLERSNPELSAYGKKPRPAPHRGRKKATIVALAAKKKAKKAAKRLKKAVHRQKTLAKKPHAPAARLAADAARVQADASAASALEARAAAAIQKKQAS